LIDHNMGAVLAWRIQPWSVRAALNGQLRMNVDTKHNSGGERLSRPYPPPGLQGPGLQGLAGPRSGGSGRPPKVQWSDGPRKSEAKDCEDSEPEIVVEYVLLCLFIVFTKY
jgi:hypothetical protein